MLCNQRKWALGSATLVLAWIILCGVGVSRATEYHAVLIGVNRVPAIGSSYDLKYAESDVDRVREALIESGYYRTDHITVLKGRDAT